jgi:serine/threonine protein kinase
VKLENGHTVDRYTVERPLGQGGMATVYLMRHSQLGTLHALKVLDQASGDLQERLLREGRVQAHLRHPNVVNVSDVLEIQGSPGLLMEFVEGGDLGAWLKTNPRLIDERLSLFGDIVAGVAAAHTIGIVHRDLKPGNILMSRTATGWQPKVTDFGLATPRASEKGDDLTQTGAQMGTPSYMAPEQVRNAKDVDHRADIFALGCILYELMCGVRAFKGQDTFEVFRGIVDGQYPDPATINLDLPHAVKNAIEGCLLPGLTDRIPDCATLLSVLSSEKEWVIPEQPVAAVTFAMSSEHSSTFNQPPQSPNSAHTLPPPQGGESKYGHWLLLSVVLLFTFTGYWWVRRGATIERPRVFDETEVVARQKEMVNSQEQVEVEPEPLAVVVPPEREEIPVQNQEEKPASTKVERPAALPMAITGFRVDTSNAEAVRVVLSKRGARYPAGEVPVGTYTIQVSFDGEGVRYGGNATIQDGILSVIQCDKVSLSCTATP